MAVSIYKVATYLLLPLMWVNLTVAENKWRLLGLNLPAYLYVATIVLAWYVGSRSRYREIVTIMVMCAIVFRLLEVLTGIDSLRQASFLALAIVFIVAGAMIYGKNPLFLYKQLVSYLALCLPIMLFQILGVSTVLMGWNIGYVDDIGAKFNIEDIGSFKEVPLYPTLFVGIDELVYSIGQGRPVGLMYGSNPLSIFVSVAIAVNLAIVRTWRIRSSDIIVTAVAVLTMSKLVFGVMILLYLAMMIFGDKKRKHLALKLMFLLFFIGFFYYLLFPGLFAANLSNEMMMTSITLRLVDLVTAMGLENYLQSVTNLTDVYKISNIYVTGEGYSSIAILLRSKLFIPAFFLIIIGTMFYIRRLRNMDSQPTMIYGVTLAACVLTQFAVPFTQASSFQLIMGFALFPLFKKIWPQEVTTASGFIRLQETSEIYR